MYVIVTDHAMIQFQDRITHPISKDYAVKPAIISLILELFMCFTERKLHKWRAVTFKRKPKVSILTDWKHKFYLKKKWDESILVTYARKENYVKKQTNI